MEFSTAPAGGAGFLLPYEKARGYLEESLRRSHEQDVPGMVAMSLSNLGALAEKLGDETTARERYEESVEMMRACGDQLSLVETLLSLARVLEAQGEGRQALRLREESAALQQRLDGE